MPSTGTRLRGLALAIVGAAILAAAPAGAASYSFTTIDVPGATATGTVHLGINDAGVIVGDYTDSQGTHGFIDTGGSFTTVDISNDVGPNGTELFGINGSGQIVGDALQGSPPGSPVGILYEGGTTTGILPSGASVSVAAGIDAAGDIVGTFLDTSFHGFLDSGGSFTTLDAPGAIFVTRAFGVNGAGQIVGSFDDASGTHGFVYAGGAFTTVDAPGATSTALFGIDDTGQIVGSFDDASGTHGFLYAGGSFTTIDAPGATATRVYGINGSGEMVGSFDDASGTHGFLATPASLPEPGSLLLLGVGWLGALGMGRRRVGGPRHP